MKQLCVALICLTILTFIGCSSSTSPFPKNGKTLDSTAGKSDLCKIHKTVMQKKKVAIIYGLIEADPRDPEMKIEKRKFPNTGIYLGGCCIEPESDQFVLVYVCDSCVAAYHEWDKQTK